jgi:hypothetical protein
MSTLQDALEAIREALRLVDEVRRVADASLSSPRRCA